MIIPPTHSTQHSGGLAGRRDHVSNEGAISERMRLDYIKKQRERQEKERARQELADKKRIWERNKIDIGHREIELRRLHSEQVRAESDLKSGTQEAQEFEQKINHQKTLIFSMGAEIQKLQLELQQLKNKQEKQSIDLVHIESQKAYKQKEKDKKEVVAKEYETKVKREAYEIDRIRNENIRLEQEIKLLEIKAR